MIFIEILNYVFKKHYKLSLTLYYLYIYINKLYIYIINIY